MAVTRQSSWRSDPAAALRGLANGRLALPREQAVHGLEVLLLEQHLAAHLEPVRRLPAQVREHPGVRPQRADGAQVAGDVLAHRPVPAGRARLEFPGTVHELHRQAVQLGLADVFDRGAGGEIEQPVDPGVELLELLVARHVPEREHRLPVLDLGEPVPRLPRDAPGGRVVGGERRVRLLEGEELPHEPVVLGVGEGRVVEDVVGAVRLADPRPEIVDAPRRPFGHARSVTRGAGRRQPGRRSEDAAAPEIDSLASTKAFPIPW